jgi:hypothetical protein
LAAANSYAPDPSSSQFSLWTPFGAAARVASLLRDYCEKYFTVVLVILVAGPISQSARYLDLNCGSANAAWRNGYLDVKLPEVMIISAGKLHNEAGENGCGLTDHVWTIAELLGRHRIAARGVLRWLCCNGCVYLYVRTKTQNAACELFSRRILPGIAEDQWYWPTGTSTLALACPNCGLLSTHSQQDVRRENI